MSANFERQSGIENLLSVPSEQLQFCSAALEAMRSGGASNKLRQHHTTMLGKNGVTRICAEFEEREGAQRRATMHRITISVHGNIGAKDIPYNTNSTTVRLSWLPLPCDWPSFAYPTRALRLHAAIEHNIGQPLRASTSHLKYRTLHALTSRTVSSIDVPRSR